MNQDEFIKALANSYAECVALAKDKNKDYSTDDDACYNFREFGSYGVLVRMSDKWSRIKILSKKDPHVVSEKLKDTIQDFCNYLIIYGIIKEQEEQEKS